MKRLVTILLSTLLLVGCSNNNNEDSYMLKYHEAIGYFIGDEYIAPMDTFSYFATYYNKDYKTYENDFNNILNENHKLLDRYHHYEGISNLYDLNKLGHIENCANNLYKCIKEAYEITKITDGKFNLFMGEVIDLYSESIDKSDVTLMPIESAVNDAISHIPSVEELDNVIVFEDETKSITINEYNGSRPTLSIGGIGKGFIGDLLLDHFKDETDPLLINLGNSSISLRNKKPSNVNDGSTYLIGFTLPIIKESEEEANEISCYCNIPYDSNISTSGDYTNCYFYGDNKLMHHIINPYTGYSNNTYRAVTLISKDLNMAVLDSLSTAVFNCSSDEETVNLLNKIQEFYSCNIDYFLLKPYYNNDVIDFKKFTCKFSSNFDNYFVSGSLNEKIV